MKRNNIVNRILGILAVLVLIGLIFPVTVQAVEKNEGRPAAIAGGSCGDGLPWVLESDGILYIGATGDGSGEMRDFACCNDADADADDYSPWLKYSSMIEKVVVDEYVMSIGNEAFCGCENLKVVELPSTIERIGEYAFEGCKSLESIEIPSSVNEIGERAFDNVLSVHNLSKADGSPWGAKAIHNYSMATCPICKENETPPVPPQTNPFTDVKDSDYFYDPVLWAVENGITSGLSQTTFGPDATCTRAQAVTFLWRAAGEPEPASNNNPFTDVKSGDYYYKAVLWAVENGVTAGTSQTTFSPNDNCTRGQIVSFLWRSEGEPNPGGNNNPFTDVKSRDYYYKAVLWAVENGVTAGTSQTTFSPNAKCTRGQIVTFLYRYMAE